MIDILMGTHNGDRYIKSQILSLQFQSYKDWRLLIHDDGSTDNTLQIIFELSKLDKRIVLIEDDLVFHNPAENFMHLLKYSDAEYIMFCDQDDIWFDNKIELMFSTIIKKNQNIPQVLYSNSYVWIPEEGIKGLATFTFPEDLKSFLFLNSGMQGCVSIFNSNMRDLLVNWEGESAMHDHLLHMAGLTFGEVTYLHVPLMLYRNHNNNVTGETATKFITKSKVFKNLRIPVVDIKHFEAVNKFVNLYRESIEKNKLNIFEQYLVLPKKNKTARLFSIIKNQFKIYDSTIMLILKSIFRPFIIK